VADLSSSTRAKSVKFDADKMWIDLSDGRNLGIPLGWFPRTPARHKRTAPGVQDKQP
jgi:hypothetical protein